MNATLLKILRYGRYMGVFPFEFSINENKIQMRYSLAFFTYSFLVFILLILAGIFSPNDDSPRMIQISHQTTNVLAAALHILIFSGKKERLECFVNKIQKVDEFIEKKFKEEKTACAKFELCTIVTFLLMLLDLVLDDKKIFSHGLCSLILNSTLFYIDTIIIMYYKSCVKLIRSKIIDIHKNLKYFYSENDNIITISQKIWKKDGEEKKGNVFLMVKAYECIFEASEALNDCFSVPILVSSIVCMINVIVAPFLLYLKTKEDMQMAYAALGWLIGHILKILMIVEPSHSCQIQGKYLAQTLMKLSCNTSALRSEQLRKFYRVAEQSPIEFHMGGIAKITRSILPAILSGFTTYLVILFQIKNEIL